MAVGTAVLVGGSSWVWSSWSSVASSAFEDERQASLMMITLTTKTVSGRTILKKNQRTVSNHLPVDQPYRYVKLTCIAEITERTIVRATTIHVAQLRLVQRLTCNIQCQHKRTEKNEKVRRKPKPKTNDKVTVTNSNVSHYGNTTSTGCHHFCFQVWSEGQLSSKYHFWSSPWRFIISNKLHQFLSSSFYQFLLGQPDTQTERETHTHTHTERRRWKPYLLRWHQ